MAAADIELIGTFELHHSDEFPAITQDPFHLVGFMMESPVALKARFILDIGTNTGVIPLLLAGRTACENITGVEIDALSAAYARENAERNDLSKRIGIINKDFRELPDISNKDSYDIIISNPPYIKKGHGRKSADKRRRIARYEEAGTIKELIKVSDHLLKETGRLFLVFPASRHAELLGELESINMEPVRTEGLHVDEPKGSAKLIMIEAMRSAI